MGSIAINQVDVGSTLLLSGVVPVVIQAGVAAFGSEVVVLTELATSVPFLTTASLSLLSIVLIQKTHALSKALLSEIHFFKSHTNFTFFSCVAIDLTVEALAVLALAPAMGLSLTAAFTINGIALTLLTLKNAIDLLYPDKKKVNEPMNQVTKKEFQKQQQSLQALSAELASLRQVIPVGISQVEWDRVKERLRLAESDIAENTEEIIGLLEDINRIWENTPGHLVYEFNEWKRFMMNDLSLSSVKQEPTASQARDSLDRVRKSSEARSSRNSGNNT